MKTLDVLVRPIVTEKAVGKKESDNTLCFQVHPDANKTEIKAAVEQLFKVKVAEVRTSTFEGKMRRRGRYSGYLADWKKAYVRLKPGQKMPEYAEL
jgi:large subunit ribosomal protein L23